MVVHALEKVFVHYDRNKKDSLPPQAIQFPIGDMPHHISVENENLLDSFAGITCTNGMPRDSGESGFYPQQYKLHYLHSIFINLKSEAFNEYIISGAWST